MNVEVTVVESVVYVVVPVEVVVEELELEELGVGVELTLEEDEDGDGVGVQFGRLMVPVPGGVPHAPDPHCTIQFLEQAASPVVLEVCQHGA